MAEFEAEGRGQPGDDSMIGLEIRSYRASWHTPDGFERYLRTLRDLPREQWQVPCTTLWWVDGTEYLGRLAIRHLLNDRLRERGGHIGYDVRPSARRLGHATTMLAAALPLARRLGIEEALLTCDPDNVASQRVIESNGGRLEGRRNGLLRYLVPTSWHT
jgi:predicted acetyltransferase